MMKLRAAGGAEPRRGVFFGGSPLYWDRVSHWTQRLPVLTCSPSLLAVGTLCLCAEHRITGTHVPAAFCVSVKSELALLQEARFPMSHLPTPNQVLLPANFFLSYYCPLFIFLRSFIPPPTPVLALSINSPLLPCSIFLCMYYTHIKPRFSYERQHIVCVLFPPISHVCDFSKRLPTGICYKNKK